jgi:hypothetical protein
MGARSFLLRKLRPGTAIRIALGLAPLTIAMAAHAGPTISGTTTITYTGSIMDYTVTTPGIYDIVAYGADGGAGGSCDSCEAGGLGGVGTEMGGKFDLTAGEQLQILVGGAGVTGGQAPAGYTGGGGGGAGGSFVTAGISSSPLVIAGGGGGGGGGSGADTLDVPGYGGTNGGIGTSGSTGNPGGPGGAGGGGGGQGAAAGGGGYSGNGSNGGESRSGGGGSFLSGGAGGGGSLLGGAGGFGGGGGGYGFEEDGDGSGGGGGGYSGGGGGYNNVGGGGGGGSYLASDLGDTVEVASGNDLALNGDGEVVFTFVSAPVSTPEPGTLALLVAALLGMMGLTVRHRLLRTKS